MNIISVEYSNPEHTKIKVVLDNNETWFMHWPTSTWHATVINEWLSISGNNIKSYQDPVDYMALLRQVRNQKLANVDWRVTRHNTQKLQGIAVTDSDEKMQEIYGYMQQLRDFPNQHQITNKTEFDALVWPVEP